MLAQTPKADTDKAKVERATTGDEERDASVMAESALSRVQTPLPPTRWADPNRTLGAGVPAAVRRPLEGAFGTSFEGVRAHTGPVAERMTAPLRTRAVTVGDDVYFGPGQWRPGNPGGTELIAHELAHVVQQRASGHRHAAAWPGDAELTPLQRARRGVRAAASQAIRDETTTELHDLQIALYQWIEENHGDEATEDELDLMFDAVDDLDYVVGNIPSGTDAFNVMEAMFLLQETLGLPASVGDVKPTDSIGAMAFVNWVAAGIAQMLVAPLGGPESDFDVRFDEFVSTWADPEVLLNFELESSIDELLLLRNDFNHADSDSDRAILGPQIGIVARRVLLIEDAIHDVAGYADATAGQEDPLERAIAEVQPQIDRIRDDAASESGTLGHFNNDVNRLSRNRVEMAENQLPNELDGDPDQDVPRSVTLTPDEMFPVTSDAAVEELTGDLAARVSTQRSDVEEARDAVFETDSISTFEDFVREYRIWLQFFSPRGRDEDPMFRQADQLIRGLQQVSLMADEMAFIQPIMMASYTQLIGGVIGNARTDFQGAMPHLSYSERSGGTAQMPSYTYAGRYRGGGGTRSAAGERSSRNRVLRGQVERTRRVFPDRPEGWMYLIETEHDFSFDGPRITRETRIVDEDVARYLLALQQHRATLSRTHTPGFGDSAMSTGGVESGQGTGTRRYIDGDVTSHNPRVQRSHGVIVSAARAQGYPTAAQRRDGAEAPSTSATHDLVRELEQRFDAYFEQASIPAAIAATAIISHGEYGSFQLILNSITPEAIATGLGIALGAKMLQKAIAKLASRAVARTIMRGLDRAMTMWGGSDIVRMAQLAIWLAAAGDASRFREARVNAYTAQFAADALGNLIQSGIVSSTMSLGSRGLGALSSYREAASPRSVRELTNLLGPITADPAARTEMLGAVREEIALLETTTGPHESNPDLMALRTIENELMGRSGTHDAADVALAHDQRTPQERAGELLDQMGLDPADRAQIEDAVARGEPDAVVHEGTPSRVLADVALTDALGVSGVPAVRNNSWASNGVRVKYTTREVLGHTIVDSVHVEAGRDASLTDVQLHAATARRMRELQGVSGVFRRLWGRMSSAWSSAPPDVNRPGTLGFEAHAEIQKLPEIIQQRHLELAEHNANNPNSALDSAVSTRLQNEIATLEYQLAYYEMIVLDVESAGSEGRGYIAAQPTYAIPQGGVSVADRVAAGHTAPPWTAGREHLVYFADGHYRYRDGVPGRRAAPRMRRGQAFDPALRRPRLSDFASTAPTRVDRHSGVRTDADAGVSVWRERLPGRIPNRAQLEADMQASLTPAQRRALGHTVEDAVVDDHGARHADGSALRVRHTAGDRLRIGDVAGYEVTLEGQSGRLSDSKLDQLWRDMIAQGNAHLIVPQLSPAAERQLAHMVAIFRNVSGNADAGIRVRELLPVNSQN